MNCCHFLNSRASVRFFDVQFVQAKVYIGLLNFKIKFIKVINYLDYLRLCKAKLFYLLN